MFPYLIRLTDYMMFDFFSHVSSPCCLALAFILELDTVLVQKVTEHISTYL